MTMIGVAVIVLFVRVFVCFEKLQSLIVLVGYSIQFMILSNLLPNPNNCFCIITSFPKPNWNMK